MYGQRYHDHSLLPYIGAYSGLNYEQMELLAAILRHDRRRAAPVYGRQRWRNSASRRGIYVEDIGDTAPIAITNGVHQRRGKTRARKAAGSHLALAAHMAAGGVSKGDQERTGAQWTSGSCLSDLPAEPRPISGAT